MNKFAITFRRTYKLFSKIIRSGLGEILEMHSAVFNDIYRQSPWYGFIAKFHHQTIDFLKLLLLISYFKQQKDI